MAPVGLAPPFSPGAPPSPGAPAEAGRQRHSVRAVRDKELHCPLDGHNLGFLEERQLRLSARLCFLRLPRSLLPRTTMPEAEGAHEARTRRVWVAVGAARREEHEDTADQLDGIQKPPRRIEPCASTPSSMASSCSGPQNHPIAKVATARACLEREHGDPQRDEAALVDALSEGVIAGAGLDVQSTEPPREDSPLYALDNVILTPHIGWKRKETREALVATVAANIASFYAAAPQNVVS